MKYVEKKDYFVILGDLEKRKLLLFKQSIKYAVCAYQLTLKI